MIVATLHEEESREFRECGTSYCLAWLGFCCALVFEALVKSILTSLLVIDSAAPLCLAGVFWNNPFGFIIQLVGSFAWQSFPQHDRSHNHCRFTPVLLAYFHDSQNFLLVSWSPKDLHRHTQSPSASAQSEGPKPRPFGTKLDATSLKDARWNMAIF